MSVAMVFEMMDAMLQAPWKVGLISAVIIILIGQRMTSNTHVESSGCSPPDAPNGRPFVGHALKYKADPPGYLLQQAKALGGVFRLNLAGLRMAIISSETAIKAVATAAESELSLKHAVADFGFLEALGPLNVYMGNDVHRFVIKNNLYPSFKHTIAHVLHGVNEAVDTYLPGATGEFDMIPTMRKIALKFSIDLFIGRKVLEMFPDFIDQFIVFQDELEEAIAKSTALPSVLANLLLLGPTRRHRQKIEKTLAKAIAAMWKSNTTQHGMWTKGMQSMCMSDLPGWSGRGPLLANCNATISADDAASLCCGLLFASHKNPSIGIAQTLLFIVDQDSSSETRRLVVQEVARAKPMIDVQPTSVVGEAEFDQATKIFGNCVREGLRLSSHSIGAIRKVMKKGGFAIPTGDDQFYFEEGSYIGISHILPHLDESIFEQAQTFNPSRFEKEEYNDYQFTAFSHGLHRCPGRRLAMLMMKAIGVRVLGKHTLTLATTPLPPLSFERATLAQRSGPCVVKYKMK